jgi:predicted DNA-binding ribbon-helix-helix protein
MKDLHSTQRARVFLDINGRRTLIVLEKSVWDTLIEICRREELSLDEICETAIAATDGASMASTLRMYALGYFKDMPE